MTAQDILSDLWASGITPRLTEDGNGIAVPAGRLSPGQRAAVISHKAELVDLLQAARATTAELLKAALLACDHWGDSEAARQQMRDECLALPPHQQANLLAHFRQTYFKDHS